MLLAGLKAAKAGLKPSRTTIRERDGRRREEWVDATGVRRTRALQSVAVCPSCGAPADAGCDCEPSPSTTADLDRATGCGDGSGPHWWCLDACAFEVRQAPGQKGRMAVASHDLRAGELVLRERAFILVPL